MNPRALAKQLGVGLGLPLLLTIFSYVAGTRADRTRRDPATVADGARCQLVDDGDRRPVRCARLFDASPAEVAALVRDYARYDQVFEGRFWHFDVASVTPDPDGKTHLVGAVRTRLGRWPLDLHIAHRDAEGTFTSEWDAKGDGYLVDRGRWTIGPGPGGKTLAVYEVEIDVLKVPRFVVNDVLLVEMSSPLRRIGRRLAEAKAKAKGP